MSISRGNMKRWDSLSQMSTSGNKKTSNDTYMSNFYVSQNYNCLTNYESFSKSQSSFKKESFVFPYVTPQDVAKVSREKKVELRSDIKFQVKPEPIPLQPKIIVQSVDKYVQKFETQTSTEQLMKKYRSKLKSIKAGGSMDFCKEKSSKFGTRRLSQISTNDNTQSVNTFRETTTKRWDIRQIPSKVKNDLCWKSLIPQDILEIDALHLQLKFIKVPVLQICSCQNIQDLKYCYFYMPMPKNLTSEIQGAKYLNEIQSEVQEKLRVGSIKLNFFLKVLNFFILENGVNVKSPFDIPSYEYTLILSPATTFPGVKSTGGLKLQIFIRQLELVLPTYKHQQNYESLEKHIAIEYNDKIQGLANFLEGGNGALSSNDLKQMSKWSSKKVVNSMFESREPQADLETEQQEELIQDYIQSQEQISHKGTLDVKQQIIDRYDNDLEELKKQLIDEGKVQDVEVIETRNTVGMRKKIDTEEDQLNLRIDLLDKLLKQVQTSKGRKVTAKKNDNEIAFETGRIQRIDKVTPILTQKEKLQELDHFNKELYLQNIPELLKQTDFTRKEIHGAYIMFKALEAVSSQQHKRYKIGEGVDFITFRNGIYQVFMQSEELAKEMFEIIDFNFSGYLNWQEFLDLMVVIKAKTLEDRLNLFIKICDRDGNGALSKSEIYNLTKVCLGRFIIDHKDGFLEDLCDYFTQLIFNVVNVDISQEIPLALIKDAILQGNAESELLTMFCGADI